MYIYTTVVAIYFSVIEIIIETGSRGVVLFTFMPSIGTISVCIQHTDQTKELMTCVNSIRDYRLADVIGTYH